MSETTDRIRAAVERLRDDADRVPDRGIVPTKCVGVMEIHNNGAWKLVQISARDAALSFERLDSLMAADPEIRAYIRRRDRYHRRYARGKR